jgi:predicted NBD/HSP70 family sugar kinase
VTSEVVAGVDIGGTKIALALSTLGGEIVSLTRFPTRIELGPYRIIDNAINELRRMLDDSGA